MKHKKLSARILSVALSAAMVLSMMPVTAFAAEGEPVAPPSQTEQTAPQVTPEAPETPEITDKQPVPGEQCSCDVLCTEGTISTDCPVCSAEGADLTACKGEAKASLAEPRADITTWADLQAAFTAGGEVALTQNIKATKNTSNSALTIPTGQAVTLDLAGFTLERNLTSASSGGNVITVEGELTLKDTKGTGKITGGDSYTAGSGGGVTIASGGKFTMNGGGITGNYGINASGVSVGSGTFIMSGGSISSNKNAQSSGTGGVAVTGGTFTMNGGSISNNTSMMNDGIGGVFATSNSTFTMNGGLISGNVAKGAGAGIGGVCIIGSTFTVGGTAVIKDNTVLTTESKVVANNVKLQAAGQIINYDPAKPLEAGAKIGLTLAAPGLGAFTEVDTAWATHADKFFSDDSQNEVKYNGTDKKLEVIKKVVAPVIKFDTRNGSIIADATAGTDGKVTMPANPTWTGYEFAGWCTGKDGAGTVVTADTVHTASATVYAKWTKDGKIVLTEPLDFSLATADMNGKGYAWDNTEKILTLDGLTMHVNHAAAMRMPQGAKIILADDSINSIKNVCTTFYTNGTTAIYANLTTIDGEIKKNGKLILDVEAPQNSPYVSLITGGVTIDGGSFELKSNAANSGGIEAIATINGGKGTIKVNDKAFYSQPTLGAEITTTGAWNGKEFSWKSAPTISFDARNGETIADVEITGGKITLPTDPTWTGYEFAGWYTDKDGAGTKFANSGLTASATVYAKWTKGGKTVVTEALDFTAKETTDKLATQGWAWNAGTATLTLSGLTLNRTTASLDEFGNEWGIILLEESANTIILTDGTVNTVDISRVENRSFAAAILSGQSITIKTSGKGTPGVLNAISANTADISNVGIYAPYGVTIESGVIIAKAGESANSGSIGIAADDGIIHIKGGTVTATGVKSGAPIEGEYLGGSFGLCADLVQIDDGTVNATGSEAMLSVGVTGASNVILNGGKINAKGETAAVVSIPSGIVIDDMANVTVNGKAIWVDDVKILGTDISTITDENDAIVLDAAIRFRAAYVGTNPLAPSAAEVTATTVTLNTQTIKNETVEYGVNNLDGEGDYAVTWQDSPVFEGLTADKAYAFFTRVKANSTHKSGTTSEGAVITTKTAPQDVSGTVTDSKGVPVKGAEVELKQGRNLVRGKLTDVDGKYTFENVPAGTYSLFVTYGTVPNTVTITGTITVGGAPVTADMKFLEGNKNTVVETTPGTPNISVGGMNDLLSDTNIVTTLTPDEKAAVDASGSVVIKVKVDEKAGSEVADDKRKIEDIATGKKIGTFLDLSVLKTVKDKDNKIITDGAPLTTLVELIEITVEIPVELQAKQGLTVYRVHGGVAEAMSTNADSDGEYYDTPAHGAYITLHVKNFSTYAFGYTANAVTLSEVGSGASGAGSYGVNDIVNINAGTKGGYTFSGWTAAPEVTFANPGSASTSFVMPNEAVTVTASWTKGGGGSTGGGNNTTTPTYSNTVSKAENGTVSMNPTSPSKGQTVTITTKPDAGYEVDQVMVKDANGKTIAVTEKGANSFTFVQPDGKVTVEVTYKKAGTSGESSFTDVNTKDWFYDAVMAATAKGWFNGTSENTFSPNAPTSRGMIATILHRMEGTPHAGSASFGDVAAGTYYTDGVAWAESVEVVKGYDNGNFGPNDNITREQLASILHRYAKLKSYDLSKTSALDGFTDSESISDYAEDAMSWAVGSGLISGRGNNTLAPAALATRAEAASILVRFDELFKK